MDLIVQKAELLFWNDNMLQYSSYFLSTYPYL